MPPLTNNQEKVTSSAFLGLESYTESQAGSFYGRDEEISRLAAMIELHTLTIVFGKSGTGKTSLLNAGVFPRLRKKYCLPFRIRFDFPDENADLDLVAQVKSKLKDEIDKYGFKVESYPGPETLWEYFHKEPLWNTVTPILVFDQFEEIFTRVKSNPQWRSQALKPFWEELADLVENNIPEKLKSSFLEEKESIRYNYKKQKGKYVFAFREEYLPEFENIAPKIPSIKTSRFRLMQMNGQQAYEVITRTWGDKIRPAEAKQILPYLTNDPVNENYYDLITVEPSLLSQVCATIDKKRLESGGGMVSQDLLDNLPKADVLRKIYEESLRDGNAALIRSGVIAPGDDQLKVFIEENLITKEGFRNKHPLGEGEYKLQPGISVLAGKYFLREDDKGVELTHDALTPIIKSDRDFRRKKIAMAEERKRAKEKQKKIILFSLGVAAIIFLVFLFLAKHENQKRIEAKEEFDRLDSLNHVLGPVVAQLRADSARLALIGGTIIHDTVEVLPDSTRMRLEALINDSIFNAAKISRLELLIRALNDEIKKKNEEIQRLIDSCAAGANCNEVIAACEKRYGELQAKYNDLNSKYNGLLDENRQLRATIAGLYRTCNCPPPAPLISDTANCLKLQLTYTANKNFYPSLVPDKLGVYLIPFTEKNQALIKAARSYDRINETLLERAEGSIKGLYSESGTPYFIFPRLKTGQKYLLKVATLYGNFDVFTKSGTGCEVKTLDAVPPVRTKSR